MNLRKLVRTVAVVGVALASLAACAGSPSKAETPASPGAAVAYGVPVGGEGVAKGIPGLADGTPFRVIADERHDPIAVPTQPQRVVTLSEPTLDGALALGVKPVGSVNGRGQTTMPNYLIDKAEGIPAVGSVGQFNFEAIAKLKPDLILTYASGGNNPETIKIMQQIAPVYFVGYAGAQWKTTFRNVANALNLKDKGEQLLKDFDSYAATVKDKLYAKGYADKTFSIVRWQGSNASLILKELPPGMALEAVGLKRPKAQDKEGRGHSEPISLENLSDADADYMFFGTLGGSSVNNPVAGGTADFDGAKAAYKEAEGVPGFRDLNAYKHKNVILVDGSLWTSTGGILLMTRIVEFLEKTLI